MSKDEQAELVFDDFASRLEKEFAIMITPTYGTEYGLDRVRKLATRLAMLASRRSREAARMPDFLGNTRFCPCCACPSCQLEKTNSTFNS
jgi:hypothetical protein